MATTHSSQLLSNKARIIDALLLRELMARFGHNNVGFLWQIIEPLMLMVGVMVAWSLIYGERNHGVMVLPLVLTGYSVLTLWRHMTGRLPNTFRDASGLLFHRDVKRPTFWWRAGYLNPSARWWLSSSLCCRCS